MMPRSRTRRGSFLIIVAGLTALFATLALAFLVRSRTEAQEAQATSRQLQVRILFTAACQYIQEASRLGWAWESAPRSPGQVSWGTWYRNRTYAGVAGGNLPWWSDLRPYSVAFPTTGDILGLLHQECFGWVDVRDGQVGPKTLDYDGRQEFQVERVWVASLKGYRWRAKTVGGAADPTPGPSFDLRFDPRPVENDGVEDRPAWPAIHGVVRAPLAVPERPPFAIRLDATPNPIDNRPVLAGGIPNPLFGIPLLTRPDPQPYHETPPADAAAAWEAHASGARDAAGNLRLRPNGDQLGWIRIYRDGPATFTITCGVGASEGWRDWDEVVHVGGAAVQARFGDQQSFEDLITTEARAWWRVEWSPVVMTYASTAETTRGSYARGIDAADRALPAVGLANRVTNQGGSIQWVQRLRAPPEKDLGGGRFRKDW